MPGLLINGVDAKTLGLTLADAVGWLDAPPRQFPTAPVIGRAGAKKLGDAQEQTRRLTLRGTILSGTVAAARASIDAIKLALLADPLSLTFADHTDRHVLASLESFTAPIITGAFVQESLSVEATLTAYDPLSYDNALTTVAFGANLSLGTGPVRPLVTLNGPINNPQLIQLYNKAGVLFQTLTIVGLATVGGDIVTVDMDAKTLKKNGVNAIAMLDQASDFFGIDPADQANFGAPGPTILTGVGGNITYYKSWR